APGVMPGAVIWGSSASDLVLGGDRPEIDVADDGLDVQAAVLVLQLRPPGGVLGVVRPVEIVTGEGDTLGEGLVDGGAVVGGDGVDVVLVGVAEGLGDGLLDGEGVAVDAVVPGAVGGGGHVRFLPVVVWGRSPDRSTPTIAS